MSDFAGANERTRALLRQLAAHNDVVASLVYDPLWQRMPEHRALVVSEGRLQVELRIEHERVRAPLASLFSGRAAEIAELLRASGVPLMALSTAEPVGRSGASSVRRAAASGAGERHMSGSSVSRLVPPDTPGRVAAVARTAVARRCFLRAADRRLAVGRGCC